MMRSDPKIRIPLLAAALMLALAAVANAVEELVIQQVQSDFDPGARVVHPKSHTLGMLLADDLADGATACASYRHELSRRPRGGRVGIVVRVSRSGGPVQRSIIAELDFGQLKPSQGGVVGCSHHGDRSAGG